MNETNIEKLNNALMQLIEAYEKLQAKNDGLEENISELNTKIESLEKQNENLQNERDDFEAKTKDLEYKLSDFSSSSEQQETKMDGMLSKIQSLLVKSDDGKPVQNQESTPVEEITETTETLVKVEEEMTLDLNIENEAEFTEDDEELSVLDLKLDESMGAKKEEPKPDSEYDKTKIDLGRMESLLNGLNK